MNLYKVVLYNYYPDDVEASIFGYIISENDEGVFNFLQNFKYSTVTNQGIRSSLDLSILLEEFEHLIPEIITNKGTSNIQEFITLAEESSFDGGHTFNWELHEQNISEDTINTLRNLKMILN